MVVVEDIFESDFKKCLCNDSRLYKNAYSVLTFGNISIESVGVKMGFLVVRKQATTSVLPTQKVFVLFLLL